MIIITLSVASLLLLGEWHLEADRGPMLGPQDLHPGMDRVLGVQPGTRANSVDAIRGCGITEKPG